MGAKGDGNALHHDKYTDGDAVGAMGAKGVRSSVSTPRIVSTQACQ